MALEITTEITINASPEKIWRIFMDFKAYPQWNTFIKSIKGEARVGNKITAQIGDPNSNGMTFKPRVETLIENKELSWIGHLFIPGIFDGRHKFELIDNGNNVTTFIQSERFGGILVPFFKKQLLTNTKAGFIAMNEGLKRLAEGQ